MQTVSTPDGQVYQFPDTMSREQMAAAIQARLAKRQTGSASGDLRAGMLQAQMVIPGVRANKHLDIIQNAQTGNLSQGNFAQNAQYLLDLAKSYEADLNLLEDPDERATLADQIADLRNQAANIQSTAATPTAQNTQASLDAAAGRSAQTLATDVLPNLMDLQRRTSQIPMSAKAQEMFNPEGDTFWQQTGDVFDTFREAPGEITRTVFLRSLPAMIPTVAAAIAGTAVGGPAAGGTLAGLVGGSTELGIALSQELTQELGSRGVNVEDPNAVKAWAEANPELITDMLMNARKRALAIGTVDAATGGVTGRIANWANQGGKLRKGTGVIAGGTVGTVGEGLGESAALEAEGKEQNPGEIAGEMLGAGPMHGLTTAGQMVVQKSRSLYTSDGTLADPTTLEESYRGAAGDVARELQELAKANGYNLKDIDNTSEKGAKQALEDLRQGNNETITSLVAILKPLLSPKNAKSLEDLLLNYTQASAGIKGAKKKVSSRVTQDQLDAARRLVGGLKEGQELLNALQKSNVITDLFKRGVQGGVSRFTDLFNPISMAGAGYNAPKIAANAMLGSGLPVITQGGTIPAQGALWVMGRLTDAMTGRRSKVARFVRQNTGKFGLPTPEGPSIIAAEQLKAQKAEASKNQAKEIRASLAQFNTKMNVADFEQSPIGNFLFRTGLDKQGLIDVVNMMSKDPDIANDPGMLALIDQINENLAGGENQIEALSDAILAVGAYAQQHAPHLIKFQPDSPSLLRSFDPSASPEVSSGAPQQPTQDPQQSGRQFTSPENYQAGIDANIELAETLQSTLSADPDVSVTDKGQLLSVLEGLKQPLTNPTVQLQTDIEALQRNEVSSEAIDKYVRPYLDRVTNQRDQRSRLQRLQDAPKKPNIENTEAPAPTEAMTEAPEQRPVRREGESELDFANRDLEYSLRKLQKSKERLNNRPEAPAAPALDGAPVTPQTAGEMVAEGSIIEGAVRAISDGTMAPESVDAMLSSLEASTPGIRAKIEAIVNRQPPEAPAAPALRQQDDRDLETGLSSPALPALSSDRMMPERIIVGTGAITPKAIGGALFSDMNLDALNKLIREVLSNNTQNGWVVGKWFSDNKDLAIGQGANTGIVVEFDGDYVSGKESRSKPVIAASLTNGTEFQSDYINQNAIKSFTLAPGQKLSGVSRVFAKREFDQTVAADGSTTYTRKGTTAPTEETNAPADDFLFDQDPPALPALAEQVTAPVFVQSASLSAGVPEVYGQIKAEGNKDGFMPHLRVEAPAEREGKPLFTVKSNNKNSPRQIEAIDEVLERHPDPASSPEAWANMLGDALASKDIPVQPHQFIKDINEGGAQALLSKLTPGQIADADHGFANAKEFRRAYTNGEIRIEDTGRLFLWSFLSRGVSPYTQEGLFLDSFDGIEEWIRAAAGTSNKGPLKSRLKEYKKWASTTAPKGSGQPGSGAMHNLNAFGETFLLKMSEDAGLGDGRSRLQVIHDMMSDPNTTGKEVRRQFLRMGEGVGIDNKVVSFTLLVAGYDDVMVLDRVQMRQMWNDGRFDGLNLYDGYKSDGKPVTGSALSQLTYGARGLLVYEALEKSLQSRLNQIYTDVGRPDAASVGRYHWETWVASSEQEASHATIDAILARAQGDPNPLDGVMAKEGEYGAYAYGAKYGIIDGEPGFIYNVPNAGDFKFTVPQFKSFLEDIKKAKNKVVPSNFKVTQSGNAPWYTREEVNLDALAERAKKYGKQVRPTDEELRQGQELPNGRTSDAPDPRAGQTADDREAPALSRFVNNGQSKLRRALSRRVPSKQEVVGQFPAVKALFEIGKKGSPYENGITNIEDALMLAKALGITVHMFDDHQKMLEAAGAGSKSIKGRFVKTSNGASGHVFALEPGTDYRGRNLTDIEALTTLLHEIFHGVTIGPMSGVGPMLNGNGNGTPSVENAIGAMIDKPQGKRTRQERKIIREITRLQNSLSAYVEGKPTERRPVRGLMAAMDSFDQQRNQMTPEEQMDFEDKLDAHVKYIRSKAEFSVDPFWVYAVNPKMAKLVMPETTKWIQGELRKAGNKDIQFFAHPLAISIAVVMALMASEQAEDEQREEQQRQQMQPGALSPTAGMLSAA